MKKLVSFLTMAIIAISASVCAFAAPSPGGTPKPDQFNVVGTVTKGDVKYPSVVISLDGDEKATTNNKGAYRIEGVEAGSHILTFTEDSKELGKLSFSIVKGTETKYTKLEDGSYNISVAANVKTVTIDFNIEDGKIVITKVVPAGNDSPIGPPTGDTMSTVWVILLVTSFAGIVFSAYCRKKYSL